MVGNLFRAASETVLTETISIFRTAYYLAKKNRPFMDHPDLIELQELNGLDLGSNLHSRYSSTKIIGHLEKEMQTRITNLIVASPTKLAVLIDEATSVSNKSAMIVNIKTYINGEIP